MESGHSKQFSSLSDGLAPRSKFSGDVHCDVMLILMDYSHVI